ncbi:MAG: outer membrane protein assembly factor BamA, partial [Muribaculaceae bacterium]|nr:outer membrane protein assembly factor BamA [Muribaculaceae bacterium]
MTISAKIRLFSILAILPFFAASAQEIANDTIYNPEIIYSPIPKTYEIAGISVSGVNHVEDYVIIGYSGLNVGERIEIPGDAISNSVKRFWRQGLYSKVEISVTKMIGDKVWLDIALRQQPRMTELKFEGVKGGEKKDLIERLGMVEGQQLTPNIIARVKQIVEKYYAAKGFK